MGCVRRPGKLVNGLRVAQCFLDLGYDAKTFAAYSAEELAAAHVPTQSPMLALRSGRKFRNVRSQLARVHESLTAQAGVYVALVARRFVPALAVVAVLNLFGLSTVPAMTAHVRLPFVTELSSRRFPWFTPPIPSVSLSPHPRGRAA